MTRKIYLASDSRARKTLLKNLGLDFKVIPTKIREIRKSKNSSYSELVKTNARRKIREAAGKVKSGVIIAADTISVQDKKIFGKPKGMKDARAMLKKLSSKPQWVYSGIAVYDKDNNRMKVACEKTKVYMDKLTEREIDNYFSAVSPLDKAGGFDIQGKGAFFIRRIEGCFYNVVGLPLRRLFKIFKELNLKLFSFWFCLFALPLLLLSGCSTEYNVVTGKEETYFYSTDREIQVGASIAKEVEKEFKFVDDPLVQKRVEDIGKRIVAVCDRKDVDYQFKVLDDDEVNAVSLPGGFIYVNKGLVDKVANDDELAGVLAHEVGHIVARHSIKKLQALTGYSILRLLTTQIPSGSGELGTAADVAFTEILLGYSREDELLADQLATRYLRSAGYRPEAMISFLKTLQEVNRRKPLRPRSYLKTHPYVPDRIRVVKEELGQGIDFTDYINIEQEKSK